MKDIHKRSVSSLLASWSLLLPRSVWPERCLHEGSGKLRGCCCCWCGQSVSDLVCVRRGGCKMACFNLLCTFNTPSSILKKISSVVPSSSDSLLSSSCPPLPFFCKMTHIAQAKRKWWRKQQQLLLKHQQLSVELIASKEVEAVGEKESFWHKGCWSHSWFAGWAAQRGLPEKCWVICYWVISWSFLWTKRGKMKTWLKSLFSEMNNSEIANSRWQHLLLWESPMQK